MQLAALNALDHEAAAAAFLGCCGTPWWALQMAHARPFRDREELHDTADSIFDAMDDGHWLQAFAAHPRLGDRDALAMKFAGNDKWSDAEQAGTHDADDDTLDRLAAGNDAYAKKFGHTFILCATGVSAADMLDALTRRLRHDPATEARAAADQQRKITHLRLDKLLADDAAES